VSRFTKLRLSLRLYFHQALLLSITVFVTEVLTNFWYSHHWNFVTGSLTSVLVFVVFSLSAFKNEQMLASVEAYQSEAFLMHLKVNSSLGQILGVMDVCEHGDHTLNHENCKSMVRKQVRAIRAAMGRAPEIEKPILVSKPPEPAAARADSI
jgi:hypothetical protein